MSLLDKATHLNRIFTIISLFVISLPAFAGDNCQLALVSEPPFYLSTVSENKVDPYALPRKTNLESRDRSTDQNSFEIFRKQPAKFTQGARMLEKDSMVTLVNSQDQFGFAEHPGDSLLQVKVISLAKVYSPYQSGARASVGDQGFLAKNSLDPAIDGKTFVLKRSTVLLKMQGLAPMELSAGMYLRPVIQNGQYKVRKCTNGTSYVFKAITPFGQNHSYSETEVLLPPGNACLDARAYSMPQFQELLRLQDFTNTIYKKSFGLDQFEVNDWGMVRVPFEDPPAEMKAANPDISGVSPDGSFIHYQGADPKGSDIWGQPKTVCALMKVMKDWAKKCDAVSDSRCTPETGDVSFITPGKMQNRSTDALGHKSHFTGYCIDVRPFKKSEGTGPINIGGQRSNYDSQRTRQFIDFLEHEGASPIYFNDKSIYTDKNIGGGTAQCNEDNLEADTNSKVRPCPGHSNHIHFCLLPNNFQKLGC